MINMILTTSLTGSLVMVAWLAVDRLAHNRLSALWHDRTLRLALFFMLFPLGAVWELTKNFFWNFISGSTVDVPVVIPPVPTAPSTVIAAPPVIPSILPEITVIPPATEPAVVSLTMDALHLLTVIWAAGAAIMLGYKLWCYVRFRKSLGTERLPLSDEKMELFCVCKQELDITGFIDISINSAVPTPLATGLIWPSILLPDTELSNTELRCIFLHELTHIKRRDLWVRFLALCGVIVHWYNPFMHLLNQKLKEHSEQSCDEQVVRTMSKEDRLIYGNMLLKMVTPLAIGPTEWAVTLSTKEAIRHRLNRIINAGHWARKDKVVALVTAIALFVCGTVAACSVPEPLSVVNEEPYGQQEAHSPTQQEKREPVHTETNALPSHVIPEIEVIPSSPEEAPNVEVSPTPPADTPTVEIRPSPPADSPSVELTSPETEPIVPTAQPTDSTVTIGGVTYETYTDNLGTVRLKNSVGNPDELYITELLSLDTLVDGKYPVNSRGETYGLASLADYVGESPELIAVNGYDSTWNNLTGYLWYEDFYADFSNPDVAAKYESFQSDVNWLNLPHSESVSGWFIPLYDSEHNQIGVYSAGQEILHAQSGQIRSLEDAARETDPAPVTNTIQTDEMEEAVTLTGGAIIIDGIAYPRPSNNHGRDIIYEYLGDVTRMEQLLLDSLPNGTYPKNSKGEYYGSDKFSNYLNIEPDLILATGTDGQEGYVWWEDAELRFECLDDLNKVIWNEVGYLIPLYDSEHNQIGWKQEQSSNYRVNGEYVQLTQETVEMIKAQLS